MNSEENTSVKEEIQEESAGSTLLSLCFSLILVGISLLFVAGFHHFLKGHTYQGTSGADGLPGQQQSQEEEVLVIDKEFEPEYLIVKDLPEKEFCVTQQPGVVEESSRRLNDGEILEAVAKGSHQNKVYYQLKDGNYVEAKDSYLQEVEEYMPLRGYIVITYISSTGVRLRSWVDFEAENIVKSAYVGDKIPIEAMITLKNGTTAFRTKEGLYITTDSRLFKDYTNLQEKLEKAAPEASSQQTGDTTASTQAATADSANEEDTQEASAE